MSGKREHLERQDRRRDERRDAARRRDERHYTPDLLGPPCTVCRERLVLALADLGEQTHPMCASLERGRRR